MSIRLNQPITCLPCKSAPDVQVAIRAMNWIHVNLWHSQVQPLIDTLYQHARHGLPLQNARADVGWDWSRNLALALLHNSSRYIPGNRSSPAHALAIVVFTDDGDEIPVGMLTVVPQFYCNIANVCSPRAFAWYLADAPSEFYTQILNVVPIRGVAMALLDTAIQCCLDDGGDGELVLHADPHGGQKLRDFYAGRCKMTQLELGSPPISRFRRRHVSQYFYWAAADALAFSKQFDARR